METTYNWENPTKSELWGDNGGNPWNYQPKGAITEINVCYGDFIDSISFKSSNGDGKPLTLGGNSGDKKPSAFQIDWPRDYLVSISGTYDYYFVNNKAIKSICFKTHQGKVCEFGEGENGRKFEFSKDGWMIVGFFGYHGNLIDGIGVYVKPIADVNSYLDTTTPSDVPENPPFPPNVVPENPPLPPNGVPQIPLTPSTVPLMFREERDVPPVHFLLKVESYSQLPSIPGEKYESDPFNSGGYTWKLILYPHGDNTQAGKGHVSLYLAIQESTFAAAGLNNLTICVDLKFLVLNRKNDQYLTIRAASGALMYFDKFRPVQGFSQLLPIDTFKNPCNGYLVEDACAFGAELLVIQPSNRVRHETLTLVKDPDATILHPHMVFKDSRGKTYTWHLNDFSKARLPNNTTVEASFVVRGRTWIFHMSPKGKNNPKGEYLHLYMTLPDPARKVYLKGKLRVVNHLGDKRKETTFSLWYNKYSKQEVAFPNFMPLSDILQPSNGYLRDDTLLVQIEFDVISEWIIQ